MRGGLRSLILVALCQLLVMSSAGLAARVSASTGSRHALVIGNNNYVTLPDLNNAARDARDMAAKLGELGFKVTLKIDANRGDIFGMLEDFRVNLAKGGTGLVYFAGHGIQYDGTNYLIPVDAPVRREADLKAYGVPARNILNEMAEAGSDLDIVILDACRDNPLQTRKRSAQRGLAVVQTPSTTKGSAVIYAAGPGQSAEDGPPGENGIFTAALLKALDEPGLTLSEVMQRVTTDVSARTRNRQRPWSLASLGGTFVFRPDETPAADSADKGDTNGCAAAERAWKYVEGSTRSADYEAFIKRYETCFLAALARTRLAELKQSSQVASIAPAAPSPRPSFAITSLDQPMIVSGASLLNVRDLPGGQAVGKFKSGEGVEVTGWTEHEGARWYRVAMAGGGAGFVFGEYLTDKLASPVQPAVGVYPKPAAPASTPGSVFKDCSDCPEMVVVPSGSFMMGSPTSEPGRYDNEAPVHRVTIPAAFAVGKYEVTFEEWDACVSSGGCRAYRPADEGWGRGRRPVINVSWDDAKSYVEWLSRETGKGYRLLSESEWEYVARAGTMTAFYTGARITASEAYFNGRLTYNGSSTGEDRRRTIPVGSFGPNQFGLHDVHGNVWEWVEDCWNGSYSGAPVDGEANTTGDCSRRVLRGGSWFSRPRNLRSAIRNRFRIGYRSSFFGFRVARTLTR